MIWAAIAVLLAASALWLARPFLRSVQVESNETEHAISIYRDQIEELQRDRDAGLITAAECEAAEQEIERRVLKAARGLDTSLSVARRSPLAAGAVALVLAAASLGLYVWYGTPAAPDQPLAERRLEVLERQADAGDIDSRIALLVERIEAEGETFEDQWLLARSYTSVGDHASAAEAYRRAVELSGERPGVLSAYGESLTLANGNRVPPAARLVFEQVKREVPEDPRAAYYLALAKAQEQDFEGALQDWLGLLQVSDPDAPWTALVRRDVANMARFLELDLAAVLPDASPAELQQAGGHPAVDLDERIAALEAALAAEPKDYQGWIELARLRASGGDDRGAVAALESARGHYAGAPFVAAKLDEAARELALDNLAEAPSGARGPSDEDVAAAATMSEADRAAMIEGMVAGLAARLEEQPRDLEGWAMLIRSYSVMGQPEQAREAASQALSVFESDPSASDQLRDVVASLGL